MYGCIKMCKCVCVCQRYCKHFLWEEKKLFFFHAFSLLYAAVCLPGSYFPLTSVSFKIIFSTVCHACAEIFNSVCAAEKVNISVMMNICVSPYVLCTAALLASLLLAFIFWKKNSDQTISNIIGLDQLVRLCCH